MWFKLFVLLRLPVSVCCMGGFWLLKVWDAPGVDCWGLALFLGLLAWSGVTTSKLYRLKSGALTDAGALLAVESMGAFLFMAARDLARGTNLDKVAWWAGVVLLAWALPNALILYRARRLFVVK